MTLGVPSNSSSNLYPRDYWKIAGEGKTKIIYEDIGIDFAAILKNKPDITAGDGEKHDIIEGKAEASTTITSRIFEYLESRGIPTHYREQISDTEILVDSCDMIPLECVGRFVETGSYHKREKFLHGEDANADGTVLPDFVMEFFYKNDVILADGLIISDPLMELSPQKQVPKKENGRFVLLHPNTGEKLDYIAVENPSTKEILTEEDIQRDLEMVSKHALYLRNQTIQIGSELQTLYIQRDLHIQDFKVEFGKRIKDGEIMLADVIDADSKRLKRPIVLEGKDGQRYLGKDIKPGYVVNTYLQKKYMDPFDEYSIFMYIIPQYYMNIGESLEQTLLETLSKHIYDQFSTNKKAFSKIIGDSDILLSDFTRFIRENPKDFRNTINITKVLLQDQIEKLAREIEEKYGFLVLDLDDNGELEISSGIRKALRELFGNLVDHRHEEGYKEYDSGIEIERYVEGEGLDKQGYRDSGNTQETGDKYQKLARIVTQITQELEIPTTYIDKFARQIQTILFRNS